MNESVLKKLAKPMLILAPVIWGSSFVVMKHSLDSFTPFYLLAFRFTAAVLLSLEAPFGVLCSILVGEENLNAVMVLGFALIFLAVVCSETKFEFLRKKTLEKKG